MAARVLGIIKRVLIDISQSEEVCQEVFLEIWQTAPRFDPQKGTALAWVVTMAHRRAIDRVRASQSARERDYRIGLRDHPMEYDTVSETVEVLSEYQRAIGALSRITALQREAIDAVYVQGLTQNEAANHLGISVGTLKTRLRDGLIRTREELTA